jgi:WD40 repeat protein
MGSFDSGQHADGAGDEEGGRWVPQHALGGHYGPVVDLGWGIDGACLQSVSEDQTSRIFTRYGGHWCEIARPQVPLRILSCKRRAHISMLSAESYSSSCSWVLSRDLSMHRFMATTSHAW